MQATTPILLAGMLGHMHVCHAVLLRVVTEFIVPIAIVHESRGAKRYAEHLIEGRDSPLAPLYSWSPRLSQLI